MDGEKHKKINEELILAARNRAAKYPENDWAKQIILICDYAHERIHETSEDKRLEHESDCKTVECVSTSDQQCGRKTEAERLGCSKRASQLERGMREGNNYEQNRA